MKLDKNNNVKFSASNTVGEQQKPCVFHIILAGEFLLGIFLNNLSLVYIHVVDIFGLVGIFEVNTVVSAGYICGPLLTRTCWINMASGK